MGRISDYWVATVIVNTDVKLTFDVQLLLDQNASAEPPSVHVAVIQLANAFRNSHALPDHRACVVSHLIQALSEVNPASQSAFLKGSDGSLRRLNLRLDHKFAAVVRTKLPGDIKGFFRVECYVASRHWNVELVKHVCCLVLV